MRQTIRVNEYYDLFDIKTITTTTAAEPVAGTLDALTNVPATIRDTQRTNPFRGFWNNDQYDTQQKAYDNAPITGQIKSPQAQNSLRIDTNGDIWCYPPNVSVPYWSRIIFRNYDYSIYVNEALSPYINILSTVQPVALDSDMTFNLTGNLKNDTTYTFDNAELAQKDGSIIQGTISHYDNANLFLRFDEYPSRSKVIFSKCDKTRNPDIEFRFAYKKGQMEPIKLNLSLSANVPIRDPSNPGNTYNQNIDMATMKKIIKSCYWCIEWIYEPDEH